MKRFFKWLKKTLAFAIPISLTLPTILFISINGSEKATTLVAFQVSGVVFLFCLCVSIILVGIFDYWEHRSTQKARAKMSEFELKVEDASDEKLDERVAALYDIYTDDGKREFVEILLPCIPRSIKKQLLVIAVRSSEQRLQELQAEEEVKQGLEKQGIKIC